MLGLEGYGSGTDDDDDDVGDNATRGRVTLLTDDAPPAEARAPSPPPSAKPAEAPNFAAALPPPKVTTGSLFASLPAPGASCRYRAKRCERGRVCERGKRGRRKTTRRLVGRGWSSSLEGTSHAAQSALVDAVLDGGRGALPAQVDCMRSLI